jgi:hypothetical protein
MSIDALCELAHAMGFRFGRMNDGVWVHTRRGRSLWIGADDSRSLAEIAGELRSEREIKEVADGFPY